MQNLDIDKNLELIKQDELVKFKNFISREPIYPPRTNKFLKEFTQYHPDKNSDDVYKTHVFKTLMEIIVELKNRGFDKTQFISMIDKARPNTIAINARLNEDEMKQKQNQDIEDDRLRAAGLKEKHVQQEGVERENSNRAGPNSSEQQRNDAQRAAEQRAAEQRAAEQRAAEQRAAEQRAAKERAAKEKAAEEKAREAEQRAAEQRAAAKRAAEEKAAKERAAKEKAAEEKAREAEQRAAAKRAAEEKAAKEKAAKERAAKEKAAEEKAREAEQRAAAKRAAAKRAAEEKAAKEKAAKEKAAEEKTPAEKAREAEQRAKKATILGKKAADIAREYAGMPYANSPKRDKEEFVDTNSFPRDCAPSQNPPNSWEPRKQSQGKKTSRDFAIFRKYYEGFCIDRNQVMLDEKSLEKSFESFKLAQNQKFKSENGVSIEDGNKIDDDEFGKFLKGLTCKVDNNDPFILAMREYRLFTEFRSSYTLILASHRLNPSLHPRISEDQLKLTFDSFRRGEYKVFYPSYEVNYNKEDVHRYLGVKFPDESCQTAEYKKISSDPVFIAYNFVASRYCLQDHAPNSQNIYQNTWESILSSVDRAKEYLLKLNQELEKIKLQNYQKSKFQELKDLFEKLSQNISAPTSNPLPQSKSGDNFMGNKKADSVPIRPSGKPISTPQNMPSSQPRPLRPDARNKGSSKIAYFGPFANNVVRKAHEKGKTP